jgi:hypothetical protein
MVGLGILAVILGLVGNSIQRRKEQLGVKAMAGQVRSLIERSRALAMTVGSRAAPGVGPPRLQLDPATCGAVAAVVPPAVWINVNGNTITVPTSGTYALGTDVMTLFCQGININTLTDLSGGRVQRAATDTLLQNAGAGWVILPGNPITFGFGSNGRMIWPGAIPVPNIVSFNVINAGQAGAFGDEVGFSILSSGVSCDSTPGYVRPCFDR